MPFTVRGFEAAILLLVALSFSVARADSAADLAKMRTQFDTLATANKTAAAEAVGKKALALAEQTKDQRYIITWLDRLTALYRAAARYADAEPYSKRALELEGKYSGLDHPNYAGALTNRANLLCDQNKYAEAESLFKRALAIYQKQPGVDPGDLATAINNLAAVYKDQAKYAEAEPLYKRSLALWEKRAAADNTKTNQAFVAVGLSNMAQLYVAESKYGQAEPFQKRALAIDEKQFGPNDKYVAQDLNNLADLERQQGKYADAESNFRRALEILIKQLGPNHPNVATVEDNLAVVCQDQAKYPEAEKLFAQSLAIREKVLGSESVDLATTLNNLAELDYEQGKYPDSEQFYKRSLAIYEKNLGVEHPNTVGTLGSLASLYVVEGKYAEAEPILKQTLAISEKRLGPNHLDVALRLNSLGDLYFYQCKNADAESLYKRSLAIYEKQLGPDNSDVASALYSLASLYAGEGEDTKAEPLYKRSIAICEKQLGPEHPQLAASLESLAHLYQGQSKGAEAEPLLKRARAIFVKKLGTDDPHVAQIDATIAELDFKRGNTAEAETALKHTIAILEKRLGPDHDSLTYPLLSLAELHAENPEDAEPLLDRAIEILETSKSIPDVLCKIYGLRASINWYAGRKEEALADQRRAIELAEQIRIQGAGTEQDRAKLFAQFSSTFEKMLGWQIELGAGGEALATLERGRSRSLLDELAMSGRDLNAGRSNTEREALAKQEADLHQQVASLEKQMAVAKDDDQKKSLQSQLADAREKLVKFHQDEKAGSPVYRNLLSVGASSVRLSQLQRKLLNDGARLWAYWIGENTSYLLVVTKDKVESYELSLTVETAVSLGVKVGAFTSADLSAILTGEGQSGLLFQLKNPKPDRTTVPKLNALWQLLVPEAERQAALAAETKRIIILPDGPLADLPFESLVINDSDDPVYLLDKGSPILYAPSATVLYNLTERSPSKNNRDNKPVFTVGDPSYSGSGDSPNTQDSPTPVSRYGELGGKLNPLPHTSTESAWIVQNFSKFGISANQLLKTKATEQNVRKNIAGRTIIHLACHGIVDQSYGNFFGALALTPGPRGNTDPNDDGFLTLPEIYDLDLKGTELSILSACETNLGPSQKGEGIWALSRGFMVAGSRRVVASDWLVDDEAAANLVSYLTAGIAKQEKTTDGVDYAANLQAAKRWVRRQPKWTAPYYWAPFVMIGPK